MVSSRVFFFQNVWLWLFALQDRNQESPEKGKEETDAVGNRFVFVRPGVCTQVGKCLLGFHPRDERDD